MHTGRDLGSGRTVAFQVEVGNVLAEQALEKSLPKCVGRTDSGTADAERGDVADNETANKEVDEVENEGFNLVLEGRGVALASGEVTEGLGRLTKHQCHQGERSPRDDGTSEGDSVENAAEAVCITEDALTV